MIYNNRLLVYMTDYVKCKNKLGKALLHSFILATLAMELNMSACKFNGYEMNINNGYISIYKDGSFVDKYKVLQELNSYE